MNLPEEQEKKEDPSMKQKKWPLAAVLALMLAALLCVMGTASAEEVAPTGITLKETNYAGKNIIWYSPNTYIPYPGLYMKAEYANTGVTTTLRWTSSDTSVLKFQDSWMSGAYPYAAFAVAGPGKATVTAEAILANGESAGISAAMDFTVLLNDVKEIQIDKTYPLELEQQKGDYIYNLTAVNLVAESTGSCSYSVRDLLWTSSDTTVASIDIYGHVTAVAPGETTLTATAPNGVTGSVKLTVTKKEEIEVTKLAFTSPSYTVVYSGAFSAYNYLVIEPSNYPHSRVVYSVDDSSIAEVQAIGGTLNFLKAGTVTLTVRAGGKTASCQVTMLEEGAFTMYFPQESYEMTPMGLMLFHDLQFDPPEASYHVDVRWSSSDPSIARVQEQTVPGGIPGGVVNFGGRKGTATITASAFLDDTFVTSASCQVIVKEIPLEGVSFKQSEYTFDYGQYMLNLYEELDFSPLNYDTQPLTFTWITSDPKIASVTGGYVYPVKPGQVTITVKVSDGNNLFEASTLVNVDTIALEKVSFPEKRYVLGFSATENDDNHTWLDVSPVFTPHNATVKSVRFESSDASVATATYGNGALGDPVHVQANGVGKAIITVYYSDGHETKTASFKVFVTEKITLLKLDRTEATLYLQKGKTKGVTLKAKDATTGRITTRVRWSSSNPKVATVDENGKVTAVGKGTAVITARARDNLKRKVTCTVTVKKEKVSEITAKSHITLRVGQTLSNFVTVKPSRAYNQTLQIRSSKPKTVRVNKDGSLTALKKGSAVITVKTTDGSKLSLKLKVTVKKAK